VLTDEEKDHIEREKILQKSKEALSKAQDYQDELA
jgi:hypothetical protein